jgi:signal transduction histidine kinase
MRPHLRLATLAVGLRLPRHTVRLRLTTLYAALVLLSGAGLLAIADTLASNGPAGSAVPARGHPPAYDPARLTPPQHAAEVNNLLVMSAIALGIMAVVSIVLGWVIAGRVLRPLRAMTAAARRISEDNLHERLAVPGPVDELKDLGDTIDGLLERLEDAFAAQRRFVANASHELRTPLTLARTLLQMTLTDPQPTITAFRTTCEEVLAAGEQQEQLIEALLTLARSQRGLVDKAVSDAGHVWNTTARDFGIDGQIEFVDAGRKVSGFSVAVQVKGTEVGFPQQEPGRVPVYVRRRPDRVLAAVRAAGRANRPRTRPSTAIVGRLQRREIDRLPGKYTTSPWSCSSTVRHALLRARQISPSHAVMRLVRASPWPHPSLPIWAPLLPTSSSLRSSGERDYLPTDTGTCAGPRRLIRPFHVTSPSSARSGKRLTRRWKAMVASSRARDAPRQ